MIPLSDGIRARRFPVINSSASRIWVWLPVSPSGVSERTLTACSGSGYIRSPAVTDRQESASRGHIDI